MQVLEILHGQWFGVQYLMFDLKTFSNLEEFLSSRTIFHSSASRFVMDSVPNKTVFLCVFLVGRWTPLLSSSTGFWKIEKLHCHWHDKLCRFPWVNIGSFSDGGRFCYILKLRETDFLPAYTILNGLS